MDKEIKHKFDKYINEIEQLKIKNINLTNNLETQIDFNKKLINDNIKLKIIIKSKL
jgi:hypothetical protein